MYGSLKTCGVLILRIDFSNNLIVEAVSRVLCTRCVFGQLQYSSHWQGVEHVRFPQEV